MNSRFTVKSFQKAKENKERISMLTAYDYSMAKIVDAGGVDAILVGDSLGMVMQGNDSTLPVTVDQMVYHCRCVSRGVKRAMVVGDMPFLSYQISTEEAVRNAGRLVQEGGADVVKLEGGRDMVPVVRAIIHAQIPVMGHIGLTPQSVNLFGGFKVQGKEEAAARNMIADAQALEEAGVFAIVLESVPEGLAKLITEKVHVPTIGIGAGRCCDGQILVVNDMLGMFDDFVPKFVKQYAHMKESMSGAIAQYVSDVQEQRFPERKNTFTMDDAVLEKLQNAVGNRE
ncbi:3-methyl-2-oxobutanoate hydroxymethyltransferase [Caproicibacterium lactatifermentans]|jgi:3-methyl-2-oxobutanoate hydroxymethyltransferase|uniref:3-methyl-2-oxobutanoate hydroxymethyltransferase n=1 Tax=Caproicibacterium lactatifermentans TaxID=2666138 RepID=A0A859DSS0_9FIRM|nr:3-methyl-2-oxobutanoate hydroxymethyltransferase [Caproicibacterium lactatifermentans]ARP49751.1 3-methyl-2-oxobutanoate hydroxymethyltransferase [Ruminococcaceae bacterium CPB6]MDD4807942.1 3-methyl-2-oxobutanoate hydroxymethyltransferase [Oscillospiraceae bacterium]QKN24519.1 3-methyl-2-oxobutanoate hydroxymethyltransferase [Caproicibacterium lactatifermentans]QKO30467.1 3-methyl-2-oxobutanoate hydroxymethyltransferase [Caproicibacterium lactatifermentans]